ncbi:MAG: ABC transporter ATP-binding protein [Oscillospiraceae bacterium]|nr:ABC transporter ATP-binding protein [Oscillospiraceae bacterium]
MHFPTKDSFLAVEDLSVSFHRYDSALEQNDLKVISDLSIALDRGEILAIAGSSGSGKSLLAHAIMGLLPPNASTTGSIRYNGQQLTPKLQKQLRGKEIALVPQSIAYLDPLMRVGSQVRGTEKGIKVREKQQRIFKRFGLAPEVERLYPFQLSGGMARRVLVSTAVITDAELIIADEPTPGMHITQALEALKVFRELADSGKAIILITHDIDLAFEFADKIAVFYAGTTVEVAPSKDFRTGPSALRHPYSKALWEALPQNGFRPIPGFQPYAKSLPPGCLFAPRCPYKTAECEEKIPPMREVRGGCVRCIHAT